MPDADRENAPATGGVGGTAINSAGPGSPSGRDGTTTPAETRDLRWWDGYQWTGYTTASGNVHAMLSSVGLHPASICCRCPQHRDAGVTEALGDDFERTPGWSASVAK